LYGLYILFIHVLYRMRISYRTRMVHTVRVWYVPYAYGKNFIPYAFGTYHTRMVIPYTYGTNIQYTRIVYNYNHMNKNISISYNIACSYSYSYLHASCFILRRNLFQTCLYDIQAAILLYFKGQSIAELLYIKTIVGESIVTSSNHFIVVASYMVLSLSIVL